MCVSESNVMVITVQTSIKKDILAKGFTIYNWLLLLGRKLSLIFIQSVHKAIHLH